jgi:hypothetical protein
MQSADFKSSDNEQIHHIIHDVTSILSFEALSLAHDLDGAIHQCVPFKYQHIATILNDTYKITVPPSKLQNILYLVSQNNIAVDRLKIFHEVNIELLLTSYSLNKSVEHKYAELCSPLLLPPFRDTCPK